LPSSGLGASVSTDRGSTMSRGPWQPVREFVRRPIFEEGEVLEPAVDQFHLTVSAGRLTVRGEARPGRSSTSGCAARWSLALFVVLGSTSLMGAARADETPAASDIEDGASDDYDPWQHFNEKMFFFNHDILDRHLLKPIAKGWNKALPDVGKRALDRAFDNLGMPRRLVNNLLQGRFRGAGRDVARFGVNTTIGVAGFLDVEDSVLDLYSAVRNGYLQRRHGSIEEAIEARHTEWHPPPVKETAER